MSSIPVHQCNNEILILAGIKRASRNSADREEYTVHVQSTVCIRLRRLRPPRLNYPKPLVDIESHPSKFKLLNNILHYVQLIAKILHNGSESGSAGHVSFVTCTITVAS